MTLHTVKAILRITDNDHDDFINATLPLVEAFVLKECRRTDIPLSLQLGVAKIIEFEMKNPSVASKSVGDISVSFNSDYPDNIKRIINAHKKMLIV